jgi:1,4-dihydroxy-2-naphthoyl-CoA hydrolase
LMASGIELKLFVNNLDFAVPLTHVSADFLQPLYSGDRVTIELTPKAIDKYKFEIEYQILASEDRSLIIATAITKHIAIDPAIRKRTDLPASLIKWLQDWG